jgi:thiamine-phosphate pyrophosphorylase
MPHVQFPLYLVTDRQQTGGRPLVTVLRDALDAGVRAIQLRERDLATHRLLSLAEEVLRVTRDRGAVLLINDRIDLVLAVGADGVHLRADSVPVAVARRLLGPDRLIGVSAHCVEDVERAEADGADFAVLGPVYETSSKRAYGPPIGLAPIGEAARRCRIPVFAIGGMTPLRAREARGAGAWGVAVISSILSAKNATTATQRMVEAVNAPGVG